jgi:hypothetical protein
MNAKNNITELGQFFTPAWASELLYDAHFSHLTEKDMVWEPTCGTGSLLSAIPAHIPCIGTEIDPLLAQRAMKSTGRPVIVGNCLSVDLAGHKITSVFANPPFIFTIFEGLLARCSNLLSIGQKAGFIIPAYFMQTSRTVLGFGRKWHISQEILPRDIFPSLSKPLIFGTFIRENSPLLIGFRLFSETASMKELKDEFKNKLSYEINGTRSVWKNAIEGVLNELGGSAPLSKIYSVMEKKRPTENSFWKEQIRKVCQKNFKRVDEGVYSLN